MRKTTIILLAIIVGLSLTIAQILYPEAVAVYLIAPIVTGLFFVKDWLLYAPFQFLAGIAITAFIAFAAMRGFFKMLKFTKSVTAPTVVHQQVPISQPQLVTTELKEQE